MGGSSSGLVGKRYRGGSWTIDQAEIEAYADATDDGNPAYRGAEAVAPPMYHVRPLIDLMLSMAKDPELGIDVLRLVHGEHAMKFLRPLAPGEVLELHGAAGSIERQVADLDPAEGALDLVDRLHLHVARDRLHLVVVGPVRETRALERPHPGLVDLRIDLETGLASLHQGQDGGRRGEGGRPIGTPARDGVGVVAPTAAR